MDATQTNTQGIGHTLALADRKRTEIRGVREVLSFDEGSVVLATVQGELSIEGSGFRMDTLDMDHGVVIFTGTVNGLYYTSE
jgi:sporulation protein YabP